MLCAALKRCACRLPAVGTELAGSFMARKRTEYCVFGRTIGTPSASTYALCVIMPLSLATPSPTISHAPPHSTLEALPPAPPNVLSEAQPSGGRTPVPLDGNPPSKLRLRKFPILLRSPHQKSREA